MLEKLRQRFALKRVNLWMAIACAAGASLVTNAVVYAASSSDSATIKCEQSESTVAPDGSVKITLNCNISALAPTSSPTATPTGTPTGAPSATPTPAPTTPAPTTSTPAPTTPAPTTSSPSPTPTPSPTSSGTKLKNCFTQLAACGYPTKTTTGVPSGVILSAYTGPSTITTAGTVINGKSLGCLDIRAANVVIKNSRITGPCFYGIDSRSSGLSITDTEINCVNNTGTGINGGGYSAVRVLIRHCENGLSTSSNILLQDSYITEIIETNGGHGDGIQGTSGSNITIRHNTFDILNPVTSSIIWDKFANANTITNTLVEDNFFAAGAFTVYCQTNGSNAVYRNNRFYAPVGSWNSDPHRPAYGFAYDTCYGKSWITWTGNYRDDTLGPVTLS